jgi:exopolyphosphatase/guanosine-5'-triphosphate,3'-diphosphate pyrophosphatase
LSATAPERAEVRVADLPSSARRCAVIDVGSNSVRLVVFEGVVRAPLPVFNEKVLAGLGRTISSTGELDPKGETKALAAVERYVALSRALGAGSPEIVATAAVRDASDGQEFVDAIEQSIGIRVRVLRGRDEARLSALGVTAAFPGADGLVGDLGGGSVEFVVLNRGVPGEGFTLPLGPLRLMHESRGRAREVVDEALGKLGWLWQQAKGRDFYAVGGAWRGVARVDLSQHPDALHVIHHHTIDVRHAATLSDLLAGLSPKSLEGIAGIGRRRQDTLPWAALVMSRVLAHAQARRVVFSGNGLREGVVFERLPPEVQAADPLLEGARRMALRSGRGQVLGEELQVWLEPLFADDDGADGRLIEAACLLSDSAWAVHPDYRAEEALAMILFAPFVGIDHPGRAFVGLALGGRYGGDATTPHYEQAMALLDEAGQKRARHLSHAFRLAYTLTGGAHGVLPRAKLSLDETVLKLSLPKGTGAFGGEKVERRLATLAAALGREPRLSVA